MEKLKTTFKNVLKHPLYVNDDESVKKVKLFYLVHILRPVANASYIRILLCCIGHLFSICDCKIKRSKRREILSLNYYLELRQYECF